MIEELREYIARSQQRRADVQYAYDQQRIAAAKMAASKSARTLSFKAPTGGRKSGGKGISSNVANHGKIGLEELINRIGMKESGNNYSAKGDYNSGDRAYGKYQIMGNNIPSWTKEYLGKSLTPEQFLRRKKAQDRVAAGKLKYYYKRYGAGGAAAAWYGGESAAKGWKSYRKSNYSDNGTQYPSIYEYVKAILKG